MKSRRPLKPAAWLLLLLGLSLGGWGLLPVVFPSFAPPWLAGLLAPGGTNRKTGGNAEGEGQAGRHSNAAETPRNPHGGSREARDGRFVLDPKALPKGLTSIDGEGGTGLNRAVKKNGVWYPVYSPGPNPGSGPPPLTVIPLSIASGPLPPGRTGQSFSYQAEAIGGTPPYHWAAVMNPAPASFFFNPENGLLTGLSSEPVTAILQLTLTDAAGDSDRASLKLVIRPEKDLTIDTVTLPVLPLGEPVDFAFTASGGVPPYVWDTGGITVNGLTISPDGPDAGRIQGGPPVEAREDQWRVQVTDAQGTRVEKTFTVRVAEDLEVTTPAALPAASPGQPYHGRFAAAGGTPPYLWTLESGHFPDVSWTLAGDGTLTGTANPQSTVSRFTLKVTDATGETFEKTFTLVISDLLILVPSREKVGVAWHPGAVSEVLAAAGTGAAAFRVVRDGLVVYEGNGSNFVDRGLPTGTTPRYQLTALTTDGQEIRLGEKETAVLPQVLTRAQPGSSGDPYADRVVSFQPLSAGGYGAGSLPANVTGPPDGRSVYSPAYKPGEVLSLHARHGAGGSIELEFTDNIVEIGPGEDLTVFENVLFVGGNANQRFMEPAVISVALFPGEWHALPCAVMPPAGDQPLDLRNPFYYARGFAGRNGTTGDDPTNPGRSGGDSLDLDEPAARAGLSWIRFIKIQSTGDRARRDDAGGHLIRHPDDPAFSPLSGAGSSGFDLDAVSAVNY